MYTEKRYYFWFGKMEIAAILAGLFAVLVEMMLAQVLDSVMT